MELYSLLESAEIIFSKDTVVNKPISLITDDSRQVCKDCLFVCVKGENFDGHDVAKKALEAGAAAIVTERFLGVEGEINVPESRVALGNLAAAWYGHPERELIMTGVTGTKGKSTITKLVKEMLMAAGFKTGLIGTLQNEIGDTVLPSENSTPMAMPFFQLLRQMRDEGCTHMVMEVSSFGLSQHRIGCARYKVAAFTNLSLDHLEYHRTMENYFLAKARLFEFCETSIIGLDDSYGRRLYEDLKARGIVATGYSAEGISAEYMAENIQLLFSGSTFTLTAPGFKGRVHINLPGLFNVKNALAAISIMVKLGIDIHTAVDLIGKCEGVKGRCEVLSTPGLSCTVICDYAHTPDSLKNILSSLKGFMAEGKRLICLFGCGGNRDRSKRPLMAAAVSEYADYAILTSDNPRDENPMDILSEIAPGLSKETPHSIIPDRIEAIEYGLGMAQEGDVLLLAGKGHEDYQVLAGGVKIHLDDREVVRDYLMKKTDKCEGAE